MKMLWKFKSISFFIIVENAWEKLKISCDSLRDWKVVFLPSTVLLVPTTYYTHRRMCCVYAGNEKSGNVGKIVWQVRWLNENVWVWIFSKREIFEIFTILLINLRKQHKKIHTTGERSFEFFKFRAKKIIAVSHFA